MNVFTRRLIAARGLLELGQPEQAWAELEQIEPALRTEVPVLGLRAAVLRQLGRWEAMAEVCRHLVCVQPQEPCWVVGLADATRRTESIDAARLILGCAEERFPRQGIIPYLLGCYAAWTGEIETAKDSLRRAFALEPGWREKARADPVLEPLWREC